MDDEKEVYWCVICGRAIEPQESDIGNLYVHDDVPHPVDMTFDDEVTPQ